MKKSTPPHAPPPIDPNALIAAQARALPSVYSPFGTATYSGDPTAGVEGNEWWRSKRADR